MAVTSITPLQDQIKWQFTVSEQGFTSRYGTYAGAFWKQLLPAGLHVPELHPPKKIPQELYERAQRRMS